jgi:hypothetical protein
MKGCNKGSLEWAAEPDIALDTALDVGLDVGVGLSIKTPV